MSNRNVLLPCLLLLLIHSPDPPHHLHCNGRALLPGNGGTRANLVKRAGLPAGRSILGAAWDDLAAEGHQVDGVCLVKGRKLFLVEAAVWTGAQRHERELRVQGKQELGIRGWAEGDGN